jgi:hypothetical protein
MDTQTFLGLSLAEAKVRHPNIRVVALNGVSLTRTDDLRTRRLNVGISCPGVLRVAERVLGGLDPVADGFDRGTIVQLYGYF